MILAFFQDTGEKTAGLVVKLNDLVKQNTQKGLKAVAIIMSGPDSKPWLEKLAAEKGISIPLAYLPSGKSDSAYETYKLNPKVQNTLLVSTKKRVYVNFVNVSDDTFQQVVDASSKMLEEK